jgi:hypothetical protein
VAESNQHNMMRENGALPFRSPTVCNCDGALSIPEAFRTATGTFVNMLGFAIIAVGAPLPWALPGNLGVWLYRFVRKARTARISSGAAVA